MDPRSSPPAGRPEARGTGAEGGGGGVAPGGGGERGPKFQYIPIYMTTTCSCVMLIH